MRRAEEDELVEVPQPFVARQRAVMAGAAGDETAHAVPDEHELAHRHRPELQQGLEQIGERSPVDGNMKAAVVVQIDRRVPEVARQRGAVIVPLAPPLQIVHAQAVQQHDHLAAGLRDGRGQRLRARPAARCRPGAAAWRSPAGCSTPPGSRRARRSARRAALRARGQATALAEQRARDARAACRARARRGRSRRGCSGRPGARSRSCGPASACANIPGMLAMLWCIASTRSTTPAMPSMVSRLTPRRSAVSTRCFLVMTPPFYRNGHASPEPRGIGATAMYGYAQTVARSCGILIAMLRAQIGEISECDNENRVDGGRSGHRDPGDRSGHLLRE